MTFNPEQQRAISTIHGPLLILAGAGSGKTTVLVHRIARIVQSGVAPDRILAIAFTNKAANELRERIHQTLGDEEAKGVWVSTFHRLCLHILREEGDALQQMTRVLRGDFRLITGTEQKNMVHSLLEQHLPKDKTVEKEKKKSTNPFTPSSLLTLFSLLKAELAGPKSVLQQDFSPTYMDDVKISEYLAPYKEKEDYTILTNVYAGYQKALLEQNAMDLEDVLFYTCQLFLSFPAIRKKYGEHFQYVHVDEYQDSTRAQYVLIRLLAHQHQNLAVVGDDAQSIYGFRGADIRNILHFERDYPNATVIKLEENYRSTETILQAANELIGQNEEKKEKQLRATRETGEKIKLLRCELNSDEAARVAEVMTELVKKGRKYRDIAVFYRNNSDASSVERLLKKEGIPFKLSKDGGFFDQPEIIDIQKYLVFLENPKDVASFKRIIHTPKRGVGKTTVDKLIGAANGGSLLSVCRNPERVGGIGPKIQEGLSRFVTDIDTLLFLKDSVSIPELIREVLTVTEYEKSWEGLEASVVRVKKRNIDRLILEAEEITRRKWLTLPDFIEDIKGRDIEAPEEDEAWNEVTLSTIHAAKGTEFPVVFMIGMTEGTFPSKYATSPLHIEEERRLCHVGMTRAKELLLFTQPTKMLAIGEESGEKEIVDTVPSRFLGEFDASLLEIIEE